MRALVNLSEDCIKKLSQGTEINILSCDDKTNKIEIDEDNLSYAIDLIVKLCIN